MYWGVPPPWLSGPVTAPSVRSSGLPPPPPWPASPNAVLQPGPGRAPAERPGDGPVGPEQRPAAPTHVACQPEVDDPASAGPIHHQVGRLDIAVADARLVGVLDRVGGVRNHLGHGAEIGPRQPQLP